MNSSPAARLNKTVRLLLAAPLILWVFVLLHVLRLSTAFNWMVKHLTPVLVYGTMMLGPLVAAYLGWRMLRRNAGRR